MAGDHLTVLHSVNRKHAAKQISRHPKTGKISNKSYGNEKHFRVEERTVSTFAEFCDTLAWLTGQPFAFPIRAAPLPGINLHYSRRLLHPDKEDPAAFQEVPRRWFLVDVDHIPAPALTDPVTDPEGAVEDVISLLSPELADVSCFWQWSSSQSLIPCEQETLSLHLWYLSATALTGAQLIRWTVAHNLAVGSKVIDPAAHRAVQPLYTAFPLFTGMLDPLPRRCGIRRGLEDEAVLVIPPADAKNPELASGEGYEPGLGVDAYLAKIGGAEGVRQPILSATASYFAIYGGNADCEPLKKAIREAVDNAELPGYSEETLERYKSDKHLDEMIAWVRQKHGNRPGKGWAQPIPPHLDEPPPPDPDADPQPSPPFIRPIVQVIAGELPNVVDAAEAILVEADRDLYEFGDQVVRPARRPIRIADNQTTRALRLVPVRLHHMIERFTRCIDFRKFNRREAEWLPIDCPEAVAKTYLERVGLWRLRKLTALTSCPMLLRDGRIVERPGFDAATGIVFDPQGMAFPSVPAQPSMDDAQLALEDLKALFREFPFVDERSQSVLLSALLTSVSRLAFDFAPLHGFDAPIAGTGKSKLVDCCVILVDGHECPVISQGDDETEFEKRLGAELLEGSRMISIDNCEAALGGQLLCQTATQHFIKVRVLGFSKSVLIVNGVLLFATGNNLKLYGDMLRRGLICRLDAGEERPELRTFEQEDPVRVLKRERGRYAVDALIVLRAYIAAGRPIDRQSLGGFEGWSELVRNALLWLGQADPVDTIESARAEDPERQHLEAVITQWRVVLNGRAVTARTVIEEACAATIDRTGHVDRLVYAHPEFRNALLDIAHERGRVSATRLGKWLGRNKHKVVGNNRLAAATLSAGNARWKLEQREPDGNWR